MSAPKLSTRCGACHSGAVDRRTLYGGEGPDESSERWTCADCGAVAWFYCDGTLSSWCPKSPSPPPIDDDGDYRRSRDLAVAAAERSRIVAWMRAREEPELDVVIELLERGAHLLGGYRG